MHTQRSDVPVKSDRRTGDSSNVALNQTIKLARKKKNICKTGRCVPILGEINLQHTRESEHFLKTYRWLSNVVKKYYGW